MSTSIRHKYKYFHPTLQRAKDRRQKFHFCRLPFHVGPRNVKLNLSSDSFDSVAGYYNFDKELHQADQRLFNRFKKHMSKNQ